MLSKIQYAFNVSLDGFIEDAQGSLDWSNPDEELHRHFNQKEAETDIFLYGRRLYEIMAGFWPTADQDLSLPAYILEYARIWNAKPKLVFSKSLSEVGPNSRLVRDDLAGEVRRLKAQPGKSISVGGAELAASVMELGLIDEYSLYIHPVILGGGKPMFPALRQKIDLELVETQTFTSGVVLLRYRLAGEG
jgi:dihydrofolate reductase